MLHRGFDQLLMFLREFAPGNQDPDHTPVVQIARLILLEGRRNLEHCLSAAGVELPGSYWLDALTHTFGHPVAGPYRPSYATSSRIAR